MPKKKATSSVPSPPPVSQARSASKKRAQTTQPTVTPFQKKVYAVASKIPPGYVSTYGAIAQALGCKSAQAVGQALRRNPFAPTVPCHRVISADLCIGGFFGAKHGEKVARKLKLLSEEGLEFDKEGRLCSKYHDRVITQLK